MAICGELPSHAVTTWIGCLCISSVSRLARRLWNGRGHGLRPARLMSRMNCGCRLHARHPRGCSAFSRRRAPITYVAPTGAASKGSPGNAPATYRLSPLLCGDRGGILGVHRVAAGRVQTHGKSLGDEAPRAARDVQDLPAAQLLEVQREHLEILSQRPAEERDALELEPGFGRKPATFCRWPAACYQLLARYDHQPARSWMSLLLRLQPRRYVTTPQPPCPLESHPITPRPFRCRRTPTSPAKACPTR